MTEDEEVVRLAQELGLARLGKLSIDGTKVRANASRRKAMSYDRMQVLLVELVKVTVVAVHSPGVRDVCTDGRLAEATTLFEPRPEAASIQRCLP